MIVDRCLTWDGCFNVRDLGGLPTTDGRGTRWGAVVRSEAPDLLTADGWSALQEHGIRTIVDLRNADELKPDAERPAGLNIVRRPLEAAEDAEFWDRWAHSGQFGTPLYYRPFLEHIAADYALSAIGLAPLFKLLGQQDQGPKIDEYLAGTGTSLREVIIATLASLDAETYLRAAGLGDGDLTALRSRLLDPAK
ncbi:MAG: tyrosine-protein phosphatase [Pseudonocardiaceae bacterium]